MNAAMLAKLDRLVRPLLIQLPPRIAVSHYSRGRLRFLSQLAKDSLPNVYSPPKSLRRVLWGITFRSPLMNSAGMFKNGDCYPMVVAQGAAAYLGGTGTREWRTGNEKNGVHLPFVPYPRSHAASNWLGLPNFGDSLNSQVAADLKVLLEYPIGWSVMSSPDVDEEKGLERLVESMKWYDEAGVSFLEENESCPNVGRKDLQDYAKLVKRLRYIKTYFLDHRTRKLPVIVKFSANTALDQIPKLLDLLFEYGYDGVNFVNTSNEYEKMRQHIVPEERKLYDYFVRTFGGGVSGRPLKELSLALATRAVEYLKAGPPSQEFHVIRTGGIETWKDVSESEKAGISLNQWFTGYFGNFAKHGHGVYRNFFKEVS